MEIKACLFDLDGVLVDTAVYHFKAWKKLANSLDFDFTEAQNEQLKGISRMESLERILNWGNLQKSEQEKMDLATQKNDWYVAMINQMTPNEVLNGTVEFLNAIRSAGYKIGLGSASKNSAIILERTHLTHFFDIVVDGNLVSKSKPDPEVFLKGAELLGLLPQECLVFEDAIAGIEAANRAGMRSVGIGSPEVLTHATIIVEDLSKLSVAHLRQMNEL